MKRFEAGLRGRGLSGTSQTHWKENDVDIIRIDYPGYSGKQSPEEISWDEFF